jgi:hypothetical protein
MSNRVERLLGLLALSSGTVLSNASLELFVVEITLPVQEKQQGRRMREWLQTSLTRDERDLAL